MPRVVRGDSRGHRRLWDRPHGNSQLGLTTGDKAPPHCASLYSHTDHHTNRPPTRTTACNITASQCLTLLSHRPSHQSPLSLSSPTTANHRLQHHRITVSHSSLTPTITPIAAFAVVAHQCQPPPATPPHHSASLCSHNRNLASTQVLRSATNALCAITAVQIALVDALYSLNIPVAGIVGHSLGEVAAAYVRTCLCARYLGYTEFRNNLAVLSMRPPPQLRPTIISLCAHTNVFDRHLMYSS
jgi:hypothetical protein